jgi:hypothetical protein
MSILDEVSLLLNDLHFGRRKSRKWKWEEK